MKNLAFSLLLIVLVSGFAFAQGVPIASMSQPAPAQTDDLTKVFDEYSLELPNATWKVVSKTGNAEIIYGDRLDGYLQVRKAALNEGETLGDVVEREQNQRLQFVPGFVNGKEETFKGSLSGRAINYEFTQSGKPMTGRVYFLQSGKDVYVLRFTGSSTKLRLIRNQTDSIARSFKLKS
jgi:hypothetical protein